MRFIKLFLSISLMLFTASVSFVSAQSARTRRTNRPAGKTRRAPQAAQSGQTRPATSYKDLKYQSLNKINLPEPFRFELPNGMIVYLVEDKELPMINASAMIRVGARWEPVDKAGLAAITGTVMRTGGTAARAGDRLDEELDRVGAIVETAIGEDTGGGSISVLKEDTEKGLSILADILQNPAFPEEKIELAKIEQRDAIARRNDDPQGIAFREFERVIYGKDSPYGHQPEYETINAIKREDLMAFHRQFFQPENVVLGVWGDFNAQDMRARVERAFSGWARGGRARPVAPAVDSSARNRAGLYLINKDDVNQSTVVIGHLGGKRNDPDYYALTLMNDILGSGGFTSRLVSRVRTGEGLAYTVFSDWDAGWDRPGTFIAGGGTKSETTVKIVNAIRREIDEIRKSGVTDTELERAKDSFLKGFAFEFDSTAKIVNRLLGYEYYGYPRDYLERFRTNVERVTKSDIQRVANQYLRPDETVVVVVGREKEFDQPLSSLGQVMPIDIAIPQPKEEIIAAATPEAMARGKKILLDVREAIGGQSILAIKDYSTMSEIKVTTPQGELALKMENTVKLPGKLLNKMQTPVGEIIQGFDGQTVWMRSPQGTVDAPASEREKMEDAMFRDTVSLLQNLDNGALKIQALGPAEVDGKQTEVIVISDEKRNTQVKLYVDPKTNLLVKKSYTAALMGPPAPIEEIYSEYRETSGVKMPGKVIINQNGKKFGEQTVTSVKINSGIADNVFVKP